MLSSLATRLIPILRWLFPQNSWSSPPVFQIFQGLLFPVILNNRSVRPRNLSCVSVFGR
ncbi:hypothetical protein PGTUg99_017561 [Puccinia graminis f. sp. tritici]|uniref:Uncharacterized protein n=1 Tax=Puccinia graminis f. sp. tritici TaxID=56615 RepID=A0A5B0S531_PUCGR|nr:hypothetical protein PGTUg99_017561 [Puccinia graminis f. sp. tritici]